MKTTNTPLVSVVLITYNSAKFVIESLESVKAQTWKNIELVVSDDGSTDHSVQLCSDWLEVNKSHFFATKLITVPQNTGIPSNNNRGLRAATGDWIKTLSGDDNLMENFIVDNLEYAWQFPEASFITSDVREIDEDSMLIRDRVINDAVIFFTNLPSAEEQLKNYSRWPAFLNTPAFFCKREVWKMADYCDEEFRIYDDMTAVFRIMGKGVKLYYMNKPTVEYRVSPNSISRSEKVNDIRENEAYRIFKKYQTKHLNIFNPFDLSIYYENWLRFKYKGFKGHKGISYLRKLNLYYWYMRFKGVKSY